MHKNLTPSEVFGKNGAAAGVMAGYEYRPEQEKMMAAVQHAIVTDEVCIIEAGTGVGKTLAYLVPAVASGRQTIVATGTRTLMEQLVNKDVPILEEILQTRALRTHSLRTNFVMAVLKGRSNYLCLLRLGWAFESPDLFEPTDRRKLANIRRWSDETQTGDVSELSGFAEDDPVLRSAVCQAETCPGFICPHYSRCFLFLARARAMEADLIITNHHLLMADMAMTDENDLDAGTGPLLPSDANLIIDEAHGLEDVATNAFGVSTTKAAAGEIARDVVTYAGYADHATTRVLINTARRIEDEFGRLLRAVAGDKDRVRIGSEDQGCVMPNAEATKVWHELDTDLELIGAEIRDIAAEIDRPTDLSDRVIDMRNVLVEVLGRSSSGDSSMVRLAERRGHGGGFFAYPVDVSGILGPRMFMKGRPVVLTSATMSVAGKTDFFRERLGIPEGAPECILKSPYDYASQVMLYTPSDMPAPTDERWSDEVLARAARLIKATGGRAFILFTSRVALKKAAQELPAMIDYPVLVQGSMQRRELVEKFKAAGNAVLLATAAFREGVDIAGDALSCVIMDRLPFEPPDEPLLMARAERIELLGGSSFNDYQVPLAVIRLRQGFGRLVRRKSDKGVVAILDSRLVSKRYGQVFFDSLPKAARSQDLVEVEQWCRTNLQQGK
jgi:ATP-dependent DNA helicase DinG